MQINLRRLGDFGVKVQAFLKTGNTGREGKVLKRRDGLEKDTNRAA